MSETNDEVSIGQNYSTAQHKYCMSLLQAHRWCLPRASLLPYDLPQPLSHLKGFSMVSRIAAISPSPSFAGNLQALADITEGVNWGLNTRT